MIEAVRSAGRKWGNKRGIAALFSVRDVGGVEGKRAVGATTDGRPHDRLVDEL